MKPFHRSVLISEFDCKAVVLALTWVLRGETMRFKKEMGRLREEGKRRKVERGEILLCVFWYCGKYRYNAKINFLC